MKLKNCDMIEFVKLYFTDADFFVVCTLCIIALGVALYAFYRISKEK